MRPQAFAPIYSTVRRAVFVLSVPCRAHGKLMLVRGRARSLPRTLDLTPTMPSSTRLPPMLCWPKSCYTKWWSI
jgi:hypothetical protein